MSEFLAAIAGAIVGALSGGGVTWFLQHNEAHQQKAERNQGLARSLLFKLVKIHSDLYNLNQHIIDCKHSAAERGLQTGWPSIQPPSSLPAKIAFSAEEMGFLLSLKNDQLFGDIVYLDSVHSSFIENFSLYTQRRIELTDMLPAKMEGTIGEATLNDEEFALFAPRAAELSQLISDIEGQLAKYLPHSRKALEQSNQEISGTLGRIVRLEFTDGAPATGMQ